jgi:K+-transporting ATPase KdpF subunit
MPVLYLIGAIVSVALLVYLVFAMLQPERLQ